MRTRLVAIALVSAVVVGTTGASALAAVPTFVNGLAQAVFSNRPTDWVRGEAWVQAPFDTDGDGKLDRIHVDYSAPPEVATDGLKVPVIFEDSPYFAGTANANQYHNWMVDHELGSPPMFRQLATYFPGTNTSPVVSTEFNSPWVSRGFGVVHAESPGTGYSDGCPTSGGTNETLAAKAVIDWLNGRVPAYTTRTGDVQAFATWTSGKVGMMGTSYNGTLPIAASTTGVQGLDAIVPISAISDWYEYYRANGMVRAPHSNRGGTGTNAFLGEDLDVLADVVYSRQDEGNPRTICQPEIAYLRDHIDRATGNRSAFWEERDYMKDVQNVHAAALLAHGNNDFNVMTKNVAQFYDALKRQGVPHQFFFHQSGHGGMPPDVMINRWFTRYLFGVQNGVESLPKSWVEREAATCPPRQTTVVGDQSNTNTLTVADTSPFPLGFTPTIPVTNANGSIANVTATITSLPDATHLVLSAPVATAAGQKVASGAVVSLVCNNVNGTSLSNPTPYAEWPDPASRTVSLNLTPGGATRGGLTIAPPAAAAPETLTDDASIPAETLMGLASSPNRLVYQTPPLTQDVRISGTPTVTLALAFSKPKANVSAALISFPDTGAGTILTRGWLDPANRNSQFTDDPVEPGTTYTMHFDMQPKDTIVPAGRRLALMVFSSDNEYTIRPAAGTQLTLDLARSSIQLPVVGGPPAFAGAAGWSLTEASGDVGGTVPATLALTLGPAASFGSFTPGLGKDYGAATTANVVSTAGDATLSVADPSATAPGHLVNGAFSLPQALQVNGAPVSTVLKTWSGPVSNDLVAVAFKQTIGATDPLRTGTYSKTLTFTLSTTTP